MNMKARIQKLEACIEDLSFKAASAERETYAAKRSEKLALGRATEAEEESRTLTRKLARAMGYIDALNEGKKSPSMDRDDWSAPSQTGPRLHDSL